MLLGGKLDGAKVDVWCAGLVLYGTLKAAYLSCHVSALIANRRVKSALIFMFMFMFKLFLWSLELLSLSFVNEREGLLGAQVIKDESVLNDLLALLPAAEYSEDLIGILRWMLSVNPKVRPSMAQVHIVVVDAQQLHHATQCCCC